MPDRTYFVGCSNGRREALIAAQRYPLMFDGVAAGSYSSRQRGTGLARRPTRA
jgi:poly(3-hydroxybutyrate) depolymerase